MSRNAPILMRWCGVLASLGTALGAPSELSTLLPSGHHSSHAFKGNLPCGQKGLPVCGAAPCGDGKCSSASASPTSFCANGAGCWPRFFLAGVQKAATTSLFRALQDGAGICGATFHSEPGNNYYKEAHFFDRDEIFPDGATEPVTGRGSYTGLYKVTKACPGDTFMDATPAYAYSSDAVGRMAATLPDALKPVVRVVLIFREPVARDLSLYNMLKQQWLGGKGGSYKASLMKATLRTFCFDADADPPVPFPTYAQSITCQADQYYAPFDAGGCGGDGVHLDASYDACKYSEAHEAAGMHNRLTDGFYAQQLRAFTAPDSGLMQRSRLLVIGFEAMLANEADYLARVVSFLGLTPRRNGPTLPHRNEESFAGKVSTVMCNTTSALTQIYDPWNAYLFSLLGGSDPSVGAKSDQEPDFAPFPAIACGDEEITLGGATDGPVSADSAGVASVDTPLRPSPAPRRVR